MPSQALPCRTNKIVCATDCLFKKKADLEQMRDLRDLLVYQWAIMLAFYDKDFGRCVKDIYVTADKDGKLKGEICTGQTYNNFDD